MAAVLVSLGSGWRAIRGARAIDALQMGLGQSAEVLATIDQLSHGVPRDIDLDALAPRKALELACRLGKRVEYQQHVAPRRSRGRLDGTHPVEESSDSIHIEPFRDARGWQSPKVPQGANP